MIPPRGQARSACGLQSRSKPDVAVAMRLCWVGSMFVAARQRFQASMHGRRRRQIRNRLGDYGHRQRDFVRKWHFSHRPDASHSSAWRSSLPLGRLVAPQAPAREAAIQNCVMKRGMKSDASGTRMAMGVCAIQLIKFQNVSRGRSREIVPLVGFRILHVDPSGAAHAQSSRWDQTVPVRRR